MSSTHGIIKLRRGTAAEWAASLPQPGGEVLRLGEPGYEKDTRKLKIGNGVDGWNNLDYINAATPINPEDIEDIIGSGFLVAGTGINISYNDGSDSLTISTSGVSFSGHTHTSLDISDSTSFGRNILTADSYATQNKLSWQVVTFSIGAEPGGQYIIPTNFLGPATLSINDPPSPSHGDWYVVIKPSGAGGLLGQTTIGDTTYERSTGVYLYRVYSNDSGPIPTTASWKNYSLDKLHSHVASDITNFNSSVSGLIPVKDIVAGTGIGVTSSSGIFTINSSNTVSTDTLEPDGFVNRIDSEISFNDGSRQFSIAPKAPATSYTIYNNGVKVVKSTTEITTLPDTTALYYIHFDKSTNNLSYKTTAFNFDTDIPIAQIYYNADDNKAVYFGEERHGIRMDASTHRYLHNVFGTQYVNGLSISNYSTSGDGSADSDATVAIGDGLIYDEDIDVNITNSASPSDPFEQVLYPIAQIPVYYKVGSSGVWTDTTANNFPLKVGTTAQYNLNSAGVWSAANSDAPSNNRYLASWICATSQEHAPIITIMGQRLDSSLEQATSNNSWSDLNLNGLPIVELRPLYRLIYDTKSSFANSAKAFLVDVLDIRSHIDTITGLPQNDHGNLYGLADDDHYQYVHIDEARTIDAIHIFSNGLSASGLINAASGNFTSLTVNSTGVSLEGHTHTASNITDFNSSVSGIINSSLSTDIIAGTGISITYDNINDDLTISADGLVPVVNLGAVTGVVPINAGINSAIQTLSLNGTAVNFTKGNDWPATSGLSTDTVLKMTITSPTTITWTVVTEWFNQATSPVSSGTHLFLLRGVGNSTVEGHYIGIKT